MAYPNGENYRAAIQRSVGSLYRLEINGEEELGQDLENYGATMHQLQCAPHPHTKRNYRRVGSRNSR